MLGSGLREARKEILARLERDPRATGKGSSRDRKGILAQAPAIKAISCRKLQSIQTTHASGSPWPQFQSRMRPVPPPQCHAVLISTVWCCSVWSLLLAIAQYWLVLVSIFRKIPIISPGLTFVQKVFSLGLFPGELIF